MCASEVSVEAAEASQALRRSRSTVTFNTTVEVLYFEPVLAVDKAPCDALAPIGLGRFIGIDVVLLSDTALDERGKRPMCPICPPEKRLEILKSVGTTDEDLEALRVESEAVLKAMQMSRWQAIMELSTPKKRTRSPDCEVQQQQQQQILDENGEQIELATPKSKAPRHDSSVDDRRPCAEIVVIDV